MFCSACGAKMAEGARFCFNCGAKSGDPVPVFPPAQTKKFVPAVCTNCGASLEVDPEQETAKCGHCGSAFLIEQAINNYNISVAGNLTVNGATININGKNIDNLLERAYEYGRSGDFDQARKYFDEVLDSDISNAKAKQGKQVLDDIVNGYSYKTEKVAQGILELKKGRLLLTAQPMPILYELNRIFDLNAVNKSLFSSSKAIQFVYHGIPTKRVSFNVVDANAWYVLLEDAKMGKYPPMRNLGELFTQRMAGNT